MTDQTLAILLPKTQMSAADIIGRAIRITRLNWLVLIRLFFIPCFFYSISFCSGESLVGQLYYSPVAGVMYIVTAFIVLILTRWEIGVLSFALTLLICGKADHLRGAITQARARGWFILMLNSSIVLADCCILAMSTTSNWLVHEGHSGGGGSMSLQLYAGIILDIFNLLFDIPLSCLEVLVMLFIASLVAEDLKLWDSIKRCGSFIKAKLGYVAGYLVLLTLIEFMITAPSVICMAFQLPVGMFPGSLKEVLTAAMTILQSIFVAPFYAFIFASTTIASVCMYEQLVMRLECSDLTRQLTQL